MSSTPTYFASALTVIAVVYVIHGERHHATWLVVTVFGGAALGFALKEIVGRARPVLPDPVSTAPGLSFPSGHALGASIGCCLLLLITLRFLPTTLFSQVLQRHIRLPSAEFEEFWTSAREILPNPSETRKEFNGASNLIAWRFRGCVEYHQAYLESWLRVGVAASFEEQYARERSLFGMFVCGVSTVESVCYACYALASGVPTLMLPFDERSRRIATPKRLYEQLEEKSSGSSTLLLFAPYWAQISGRFGTVTGTQWRIAHRFHESSLAH